MLKKIVKEFILNMKKFNYKITFLIYKIFTTIYSHLTCLIENIIFKQNSLNKNFNQIGIFKQKLKININEISLNSDKYFLNENIIVHKLKKSELEILIKLIFNKKMRIQITKITGFKYSLDYFRIYENKHIKVSDDKNSIKRKPHFDKAFSRNMIKIFIPLNVDINSGPLKVVHKNIKARPKHYETNIKECSYFLGDGDLLYGMSPNMCWHHEGNPLKGKTSKQIMIQLNPSKNWCFRKDLHLRQTSAENKFPSFNSLFLKTTKII